MTIIIVTDNHLFSIAIRTVIKKQYPDCAVVETNTVHNAIALSTEFQIMILDAGVPDAKDTVLLGNFKKAHPGAAILVNLGDQLQFMYTFIRSGVTALFSNKSLPEEISEGLRRAETNIRYVSSDIQPLLLLHITEKPVNQTLTKKEELMADLLITNKSYREIAVITGGTSKSVGYYKRRIFQKLEVGSLIDLAIKLNKVFVNKEHNY